MSQGIIKFDCLNDLVINALVLNMCIKPSDIVLVVRTFKPSSSRPIDIYDMSSNFVNRPKVKLNILRLLYLFVFLMLVFCRVSVQKC